MKHWHFVVTVLLLGTSTSTLLAQKNDKLPAYQEKGTRDVSENAWSSWGAPVSTIDPSQLLSSDSTDSTVSNGVVGARSGPVNGSSIQLSSLTDGKPVRVEKSKPIQEVETGNTSMADVQPAPVVGTVPTKSGSNRILLIAGISVAVLAYRKFRRANAGPYPSKPSFL